MSPNGKRILVVERDASGRALMDRVLGSSELGTDAVASVKDVEDALAAASRVVEAQGPVAAAVAAWGAFRDAVREGTPAVPAPEPEPASPTIPTA